MMGGCGVRGCVTCGRAGRASGKTGRAWANTTARTAAAGDTDREHCITAPMPTADRLVERLAELLSFYTRNPDGDERPIVRRLAEELRALGAGSVDEVAVGDPAHVYARFGGDSPRVLLNAHVDTVPANDGYTSPPHLLVRRDSRLYGLGTADIKGAIAAILEALAAGPVTRPVGVLFSGDEEHGGGWLRRFLDSDSAAG